MSAPNGSAFVPADQRARLHFRLRFGTWAAGVLSRVAADLSDEIDGSPLAVVVSRAIDPERGGTSWVGRTEAFTSLDLKTAHFMPTMTWDQFLEPFRRPFGIARDFFSGVTVELTTVDLLTPAGLSQTTAPAQRTEEAQQRAGDSRANVLNLSDMLATAGKRAVLVAVLLAIVVLAYRFGPQLAALARRRKAAA